jgi:hypothetical protein
MEKTLKKQVEELDDRAREYERWLYDNTGDPAWGKKVSEYHSVLYRLAQKKQQLSDEGKQIHLPPETLSIPRYINRSENVTR